MSVFKLLMCEVLVINLRVEFQNIDLFKTALFCIFQECEA